MSTNNAEPQPQNAGYYTELTVENLKCFKSAQALSLKEAEGAPAMFTIILGNNGTGKTTLLKALALMEPQKSNFKLKNDSSLFLYYSILQNISILLKYRADNFFYLKGQIIDDKNSTQEYSLEKAENPRFPISTPIKLINEIENFGIIYAYGTTRQPRQPSEAPNENSKYQTNSWEDRVLNLFDPTKELLNPQDWILGLILAGQNEQTKARIDKILAPVKKVLVDVLPDVLPDDSGEAFKLGSEVVGVRAKNWLEVHTEFGWVKFNDLSHGYQTMTSWIVDFAQRMFERYPESKNPLAEPAVVLIDELDLHLHPNWQRRIVSFLRQQFPRTQFIVTAHSPLIVQSAVSKKQRDPINLVVLEKKDDEVLIHNKGMGDFSGWSYQEILTDLMKLETSEEYENHFQELMDEFNNAIFDKDYEKAKITFEAILKTLPPNSDLPELLHFDLLSIHRQTA